MFGKKEGARVSGDTGVNNGRRIALGVFRDVALAGVLGMYVFPKIFEIFFAGNDAGYKEFKKAMREEYDISEFEGDDFANVENMPLCNDRDFLSKGGVCKDKDGKLFEFRLRAGASGDVIREKVNPEDEYPDVEMPEPHLPDWPLGVGGSKEI